eukprot:Blabericola_migrator_1__4118@NODE_2254_length_3048_cov_129_054344_g682_i1_p1_GENE_NODE_2254_length_3048_cov_129_054344_g682_i1NODE_2254_length_3048_cov_129_054344_g682_i1_p1_ORF_typecomplete_len410_score46_44Sugar_tr/PF00083_24/1_5e91MFS_1/PF07690_16/6e21MFS_1/PF07690_16/1_9e08MFS_3/PF05977_13/0_015MFS_3/PF05977_13/2_5e03MFS_3/PF05977_13/0_00019MFS_2/PF13347_6/0_11MFS_2/PF13347_6/1_1OATP/PF03137_20/0_025MFS_4/PF06779_14/0_0053MFS_4/PF06779_14/35Proton_antipo_N/PF00662_20/0_054_NODE_2254_length_3
MGSLLVYCVGIIASVLANGFTSLLFSRLIVGYAVGISSTVTPSYISELSPKERRGFYGSLHQVMIATGQLVAVALGLAFHILPDDPKTGAVPSDEQKTYHLETFDRVWWRVMLGLGLVPVIIAAIFLGPIFTFETPQYYVRKRDDDTAVELLKRIHGRENVEAELREIREQAGDDLSGAEKPSFGTCLKKPGYMHAFWIGMGVALFQQITGINAYISASNKLFSNAGLSGKYVTYASLGLVAVAVPCNILCTLIIERLGRRTLLTWGSVGALLSVTPATILYWKEWTWVENSDALVYSAIVGAILFVAFFGISSGPVTWLYIFEIFPMEIKAKASSICVAVNWLGSIIMVFSAGLMASKYSFTVFFACGVVYTVFAFLCIKETKGRTMGDSPYVPKRRQDTALFAQSEA